MTREEAITLIKSAQLMLINPTTNEPISDLHMALEMAIKALENIGHLKDRPCSVCEFHKVNGCCKWTCVFTDRLFGDMSGK